MFQYRRNRLHRRAFTRLAPLIVLFSLCILVVVVGAIFTSGSWTKTNTSNLSQTDDEIADEFEGTGDFIQAPSQLANGIYMLGRMSPSVVYAVEISSGLLLIDSGMDADGASVIKQLRELDLNVNAIRAILLTHAHGDHALGAQRISAMSMSKIYAGAGDAGVLESGGPREAIFSTFPMDDVPLHATRVDVELKGGEVLDFGDTRVHVISTPGHTPGSICYLVERDQQRYLFTGDTISSLVGNLGTYATYLPPRYRADAKNYLASLRRLREMPVPDLVLPGHPFNPNLPSNPRLGEAEWHQLLERGIRELERLVARYDSDGEDFLDGNPKELLPGLHYFGDHAQYPIYALSTPEHWFWFDAPGGAEIVEFAERHLQAVGSQATAPKAVLLTSCDDDVLAGLDAFVERFQCDVVAAAEGHDRIRELCPNVKTLLTPEELEAANWFSVDVIPLDGRGIGAVGYYFQLEGKDVLVSGKVPIPLNDKNVFDLANALNNDADKTGDYFQSLQRLADLRPDLWLTALPQHGQNANQYGSQWNDLIKQSLMLFGNSP